MLYTLGRPWSEFARVVVKYSYLSSTVDPSGWSLWTPTDTRLGHVLFGEYQNSGPGNYENNTQARQQFGYSVLLQKDDYSLESVFSEYGTDWIDLETSNYRTPPSYASGPTSAQCDAVPGPKSLEVGLSAVSYNARGCKNNKADTLKKS